MQGFDSRLRPGSHTTSFGAQALGETAYQYGPSGAVRSVSGNGNTASYFYHPQKRTLENVTYTKDGEAGPMLQSTRKHDAANRLTRITAHVNDAGVQKPIDHHAYDYDALDHIQKHTGITGAFWKYGYNSTGEVTGATRKMPDATTDYFGRNYRYHYDGIGNRTSVEQSRNGAQASRLFSYTPNALNQYSSITHPDFVDVSGTANPLAAVTVNGIAASRQSDYFYKELSEDNSAGPQWIEATITDGTTTTNGSLSLPAIAASPVHDDDGNLKSDGEWIYAWDAENRLIGTERSAAALAAGAPYHREKHDYDHRNRRIRTTHFTNSGTTSSSQTLYIFDGWKCVAELDGTGQPIRKYTWGLDLANRMDDASTGNVGALLWLIDFASNKTHVHLFDKNGNVSGLLDATTRKRSATYEYDAFGQLITCYGDYSKLNPFTFSTKFTDLATELRYYGYRWYGAKDGRWLSRDPIGESGGTNLNSFVNNSPVNYIDKNGLQSYANSGPGWSMGYQNGKWEYQNAQYGGAGTNDGSISSVVGHAIKNPFPVMNLFIDYFYNYDEQPGWKPQGSDYVMDISYLGINDSVIDGERGLKQFYPDLFTSVCKQKMLVKVNKIINPWSSPKLKWSVGRLALHVDGVLIKTLNKRGCGWKFVGTVDALPDYFDFNQGERTDVTKGWDPGMAVLDQIQNITSKKFYIKFVNKANLSTEGLCN